MCGELPSNLFIPLPNGRYMDYTDKDSENEKRLEEMMKLLKKLILLFTIYYGNYPTEVYQCPECKKFYKHICEYSEDGPQNCSSEIWNRFEFISKEEADKLEEWKR